MKICLLTNSCSGIPQILHETESLDIEYLKALFIEQGIQCYTLNFHEFINHDFDECKNVIFIYASSQYINYKLYIDDILFHIINNGGLIIPNYEIFRCHENKFYQEIIKKRENISRPKSLLVGSIEEVHDVLQLFSFPLVAKLSHGFASSSVSKLQNIDEVFEYISKNCQEVIPIRKKFWLRYKDIKQYSGKYPLKVGKFIFQEFISDIDHDWKVLIFGKYFFPIKRRVKSGDFKASGSGLIEKDIDCPETILNFAFSCYKKLKSPWISLDIMTKEGVEYLIEFQGIHFGLYALMKRNSCYIIQGDQWIKCNKPSEKPEYYIAHGVHFHLGLSIFQSLHDK